MLWHTLTVDIDLKNDEIGKDANGNAVYFNDIWPSAKEIEDVVQSVVTSELFRKNMHKYLINERWNEIQTSNEALYTWDNDSTYIQNPPFFEGLSKEQVKLKRYQAYA